MPSKVTFDGENKLILIDYGETTIDVEIDVYSAWKEWVRTSDYAKYPMALSSIGGEPLGGGQSVGSTFFLENGWRIRPWEGNHFLTINGNLYTREIGESPVIPTVGSWNVEVSFARSSLVFQVEGSPVTSSYPTAQDIAQAVWDMALTSSYSPGTFGNQVGTQLLTLAQHLAMK